MNMPERNLNMNIIAAILIFSLIIVIHELGHFLLAKKNGVTVTEFSVGLGPRLISFDKGETKYSLKALPFGGSCMMLGEDEDVSGEGSFNSKGVWQRISIIFAGPIFNFILAFILSMIVIGYVGIDKPKILEVTQDSPADLAGIEEGDIITKIGKSSITIGRELDLFFMFNTIKEEPIEVHYKRDGESHKTSITPKRTDVYLFGFSHGYDSSEVLLVQEDSPFEKAGIIKGDKIIKMEDTQINIGSDITEFIEKTPLNGEELSITVERGAEALEFSVKPNSVEKFIVGWNYNLAREKISPLGVMKYSLNEVKYIINSTIKSIGMLINGKVGVDQLAGPVGVVKFMDDIYQETKEYGILIVLLELINFSILLSANLGVMNLLPIPALDGGRLVFLIIEAVRGKPIDREKEGIIHLVGIVALMVLMVFVLFNDIRNIF